MVWNSTLLLAAALAAMLLFLGREIQALRKVAREVADLRNKLQTQVDDVARLAGQMQTRGGGAAEDRTHAGTEPTGAAPDAGAGAETEKSGEPSDHVVSSPGVGDFASPAGEATDMASSFSAAPAGRKPSAQEYRDLYTVWCLDGQRPEVPNDTEAVVLRYDGIDGTGELSAKTYLFRDDSQGQFVRFSPAGAEYGQLFPHPQAFFNEGIHGIAFPELTAETFKNRSQLALINPVRVQRRPDGKWQLATS